MSAPKELRASDIVQIVPPPSLNFTVEQMVRSYLAQNGMVAVERYLADSLASGEAVGLMIYDPKTDTYRRHR